jgi:hypothetical protein
MAHRHQKGESLTGFLEDLPRIMMMQQQMELSERRLDIADRQSMADEQYRTAALADKEKQRKLDEFTLIYNATESADVKHTLLKQHPTVKNNPVLLEKMQTSFESEQSLKDRVFASASLPPEKSLFEVRKMYRDPLLTNDLYKTLQDIEKDKREELQFTMTELLDTEAGIEYAKLTHMLENAEQYVKPGTVEEMRIGAREVRETAERHLRDVYGEGLKEYQKSYGAYPDLDDDIDEGELDKLLDDNIVEIDSTGTGTGTGVGAGVEIETAGKSFSVDTMSADVQKLKESNIYDKLRGKTTAQKKQIIEQVVGREVSEEEMGNMIFKSRLPRIQFDIGTSSKVRRFQK